MVYRKIEDEPLGEEFDLSMYDEDWFDKKYSYDGVKVMTVDEFNNYMKDAGTP